MCKNKKFQVRKKALNFNKYVCLKSHEYLTLSFFIFDVPYVTFAIVKPVLKCFNVCF